MYALCEGNVHVWDFYFWQVPYSKPWGQMCVGLGILIRPWAHTLCMLSGPSVVCSFIDFKIVDLSVKRGSKCGPGFPRGPWNLVRGSERSRSFSYQRWDITCLFHSHLSWVYPGIFQSCTACNMVTNTGAVTRIQPSSVEPDIKESCTTVITTLLFSLDVLVWKSYFHWNRFKC